MEVRRFTITVRDACKYARRYSDKSCGCGGMKAARPAAREALMKALMMLVPSAGQAETNSGHRIEQSLYRCVSLIVSVRQECAACRDCTPCSGAIPALLQQGCAYRQITDKSGEENGNSMGRERKHHHNGNINSMLKRDWKGLLQTGQNNGWQPGEEDLIVRMI